MLFKGSATALITPFAPYDVNYDALKKCIEFQLQAGSDALVMCGTTGEASTLSDDERVRIIEVAVETVHGRVPVIAGTGSNETAHSVALSKRAAAVGADGLLIVTPYYNKTSPAGLEAHYRAIADAVDIPLIMYNVPSRTGMNMKPETVLRLSEHPNIVGTKEASGDLAQVLEITRLCPEDFGVYSGADELTLATLAVGGHGVITTAGNIVPEKMHALCAAFFAGDLVEALRIQKEIKPLVDSIFTETNPIPVKYAASLLGLCENALRLPLVSVGEGNAARIQKEMAALGLI